MGVTQGEEVASPARGQVGGASSRLVVWLRITVSIMGVDELVGVRECPGGLLMSARVGVEVS